MALTNQLNFTNAVDAVRRNAVDMDQARQASNLDAWDAAREAFIKAQGELVSLITAGLAIDPPAPKLVEAGPVDLEMESAPAENDEHVEPMEAVASDSKAFVAEDLLDTEPAAATDSQR